MLSRELAVDLTGWRALDAKGLLLPTPSIEGSSHGAPAPPRGLFGPRMLLPSSSLAAAWNVFIHGR